jgi:hypothetical protein
MATQAELQAFIAAFTAANTANAQQTQAATAALNAVAAANIAAANAAAAHVAAVPPVPPVPGFALLPEANAANPLDFNRPQDMKIYVAATKGLENKFDLKESTLHLFLTEVKERVRTYGWTEILNVPDAAAVPVQRNLLTNFGQVSLEDCSRHARTYYNQPNRNTQNSMFLYQFLCDSVTEEAKATMISNSTLYSLGDTPVWSMFLKVLIGKSSIDTKAKVLLLREQVANLYVKISDLKGDVRAFNTHVDQLRTAFIFRCHDHGTITKTTTAH